jgi:ribosome silencing factor RsfS/YbeB/iojap
LSTSETRARPRKAGTTAAAKAPAKKTVAKKAPVARKAATIARKTPASAPAKAMAPAKPKATAAKPKVVKKAATKAPRKRVKPDLEKDLFAVLHGVVVKALDDLKARETREIDVRGKTSVTDVIFITSGTSTRHVKSIADEVVKQAKAAGLPPIGVEGQREAEWVLVDLGDIVVHVMLPRTREFYGLERLWTVGDDEHPDKLAG